MRSAPAIILFLFAAVVSPSISFAQDEPQLVIRSLNEVEPNAPEGRVDFFPNDNTAIGTNVFIQYGDTTLQADSATLYQETGEAVSDGHVRIQQGDQIWVGEHMRYNFKTHKMQSEQFRSGKPPVFADGRTLTGNSTNKIYDARHALITSDDIKQPAMYFRASHIRIVPGKYVEMWNGVFYAKCVPVFYFPYYRRNIGPHANNLNFLPGYRSSYGPFLLTTYRWFWDDTADGRLHLDYREQRGVGMGPDVNLHLGRWGEMDFRYYYQRDDNNGAGTNGAVHLGNPKENRQRLYLAYQATPATNLNLKAVLNYQNDPYVLHDFFEGEYREQPQPLTFVEANKYWNNWSLDVLTTPRVNAFFDEVERLPDVQLTGFRQEIPYTLLYYESQSSVGYYRKVFADTNGFFPNTNFDYSAGRVDTYHQIILPWTFFGWLNVAPRAGGRFTYYTTAGGPGGTTVEHYRKVFNTGMDASFKSSRLWSGATNSLLQIDGLRHIIEPSASYIFVPNPSTTPPKLPQFDSETPNLAILPLQFPDYNDIDSIDSQNVIRFGLRNTLQTIRDGQLDNLLDWNLLLDWRLKPNGAANIMFAQDAASGAPQKTFNDLYSDLTFRPRTWIQFDSQVRYDINDGQFNTAFHQLTFTPDERWSLGLGHWFMRNGFLGGGNNFFTATAFYKVNDNWAFRASEYFNAQNGRLQQQFYSVYRDFRAWTGALTFRVIDNGVGPQDFTVAFQFSLKAAPAYQVGGDAVRPYQLVGE